MHKLNKIRVAGFRRLRDIEIEMRPLMVLIGANSVGKTSILDAVSLLSASAVGKLNMTLNNMGGMADIGTRGQNKKITFQAEMDCHNHFKPLHYQLEIEAKGQGYAIPTEKLSQAREGYAEPFKHIDSNFDDIRY